MVLKENCNFNKLNLLSIVSSMLWRIEQYKKDAQDAGHPLCDDMLDELEGDLQKHKAKLLKAVCGLAKEGKLD